MRVRLCALLLLPMLGCGSRAGAPSGGERSEAPGAVAGPSLPRVTTPAPPEDVGRVVAGSNDLGLDLHRALVAGSAGNAVLSPPSISVALSMNYAGAAGATRDAFETVLGSGLPEAAHHRAMNDLDRQLAARNSAGATVRIANQAFAQDGFPLEPAYLATLAQEYGASVRLLDFARAPEPSRLAINAWVSARTDGLIEELFSPGDVAAGTTFALVNTVLFKGTWAVEFDRARTRAAPFSRLDGSTVNVQLMESSSAVARAGAHDGVTVAALPYRGGRLSLVILMPEAGTFASFEAGLTAARLDACLAALGGAPAYLSLPRFSVEKRSSLVPALADLGLGVAFSDAADFSRLTPGSFDLGKVVHVALIQVDEEGTVAAAATGTSSGGGAPSAPERVVVDRPFMFLVRDDATGAVLFLGRVVAP